MAVQLVYTLSPSAVATQTQTHTRQQMYIYTAHYAVRLPNRGPGANRNSNQFMQTAKSRVARSCCEQRQLLAVRGRKHKAHGSPLQLAIMRACMQKACDRAASQLAARRH